MEDTKSKHKLGGDLSSILEKRQQRSEVEGDQAESVQDQFEQNIKASIDVTRMLSRKEISEYKKLFTRFDRNSDGQLDLEDMKLMMETLGAPQTHLSLKAMIREVDQDNDGKISFNDFLLIYHKAKSGELAEDSGLSALAKITEVDIQEVGVGGAKNFFESKIQQLTAKSKFEEDIKKEQEDRKKEEEERKARRQEFQKKHAVFEQVATN